MSVDRTKARSIFIPFFLVLLAGAYIGLWFYSAKWFDEEIERIYADAGEEGVRFLGPKPALENFPFVPEVRYEGGFQTGNTMILFKKMVIRGYPIPGMTLHASFPSGISLDGIADPAIWTLDYLEADIAVPYSLPGSVEYEDLKAWKDKDGKIDVRSYKMRKDELMAEGKGLLTLDDELQPVFKLDSIIYNHEAFIKSQMAKGIIEAFPGAIGITMLNGLSQMDEETGKKTVNLSVSVENRMLRVGPLQVLQIPMIVWDKRNSPVLHL